MWPSEYFNEYSNLEIEIEREKNRTPHKVFVAMWFGKKTTRTEEVQKKVYGCIQKSIEDKDKERKVIIYDRTSLDKKLDRQGRRILYFLKAERSDSYKSGNILINIIRKIIQSTIVICDITPDNGKYNENVMLELGLAIAWKMPEQVIILYRSVKKKSKEQNYPFDLRHFTIEQVNNNCGGLKKIIKEKPQSFKQRKDIAIKNIKSKLDKESLRALVNRNGLMFVKQYLDSDTIRYLLNLKIIRTEIFPSSPVTFGYCLTEFGKRILLELEREYENESEKESEIKLYDDIIIDMYLVRYWAAYQDAFKEKIKEFNEVYKPIKWFSALKEFVECIPQNCREILKNKYNLNPKKKKDLYNFFNKYLENYPFDFVNTNTVKIWKNRVNL